MDRFASLVFFGRLIGTKSSSRPRKAISRSIYHPFLDIGATENFKERNFENMSKCGREDGR